MTSYAVSAPENPQVLADIRGFPAASGTANICLDLAFVSTGSIVDNPRISEYSTSERDGIVR